MDAISQTIFSSAFSWMKMYEFRLKFHWSLFLRVQFTIFLHWFRQWLSSVQATSHYLNQWWLVYRRIYASPGLNELINVEATPKATCIRITYMPNYYDRIKENKSVGIGCYVQTFASLISIPVLLNWCIVQCCWWPYRQPITLNGVIRCKCIVTM